MLCLGGFGGGGEHAYVLCMYVCYACVYLHGVLSHLLAIEAARCAILHAIVYVLHSTVLCYVSLCYAVLCYACVMLCYLTVAMLVSANVSVCLLTLVRERKIGTCYTFVMCYLAQAHLQQLCVCVNV